MTKRALVLGGAGQAGSHMVEYLQSLPEYELVRYTCHSALSRHLPGQNAIFCNVATPSSVDMVIRAVASHGVDEIYNFTGVQFVPASWETPEIYLKVNTLGVLHILQSIRRHCPQVRFFQAGSAEIFPRTPHYRHTGVRICEACDETCIPAPDSPYGISKLAAQHLVRAFRDKYDLFACTGILFNMESPRRASTFFANKVVKEAVALKLTLNNPLVRITKIKLGRLDAIRDWTLSEDVVKAAHLMLQQSKPRDYVVGSGFNNACYSFVHEVLKELRIGDGDFSTWVDYDPTVVFQGDSRKCDPSEIQALGWVGRRMEDVVKVLVAAEAKKQGLIL